MNAKLHVHDVQEITLQTHHYPDSSAGPFWTILLSANGMEVVMFVREEPTALLDFIQKTKGIAFAAKSDVVTAVL